MNRAELAHLLSQTNATMAASRPASNNGASGSCHHSSASNLSPRQKFQAHVRTLSDISPSDSENASPSPRSAAGLHHVSSLRVQPRDTPSPLAIRRPYPTNRFSDSTLTSPSSGRHEPLFVTEEREAWSRPSPLRTRRALSEDVYFLQPPEAESPILQPSKELRQLRPFAPLDVASDINDRPKTSRGRQQGSSSFPVENDGYLHEEQDLQTRPSKFAEGSMNARSAGIASTWLEHGSRSSISTCDSDDTDATPRASPQRIPDKEGDDSAPAPATAPSFAKRLFRFGKTTEASHKVEEEAPNVKKKRGLRKSMSMWSLHPGHGSDKKKAPASDEPRSGHISKHGSPQKPTRGSTHGQDLELLNDRKRRAEEAYAQQFGGSKRRKSNVGVVAISDDQLAGSDPARGVERHDQAHQRQQQPSTRKRLTRSSSRPATSDAESSDGHVNDLDHQKRQSRRELEKENQQLRALLRESQQQQGAVHLKGSSPTRPLPKIPVPTVDASPRKASSSSSSGGKKSQQQQPQDHLTRSIKDVPPVPPIPDRAALRTLSNARTQPNKSNNLNPSPGGTNAAPVTTNPNGGRGNATNNVLRKRSLVGVNLSRPVSMILEEDEDKLQENRSPTASPSPKWAAVYLDDADKIKVQNHIALQMKGVKRENWEWPDDVF